ncbi:MAG: hypothetical protein D6706_01695, partial [Chloroflexi bacterium]
SFWRYNIPGRPFLPPALGILFYAGIGLALWQVFRPEKRPFTAAASLLALLWLGGGLAPVLITGPDLAVTQAIGLQPVLYLFPALALDRLTHFTWGKQIVPWLAIGLYGLTALFTVRDYFFVWANHPEVRVQYETTMVTALQFVANQPEPTTAVSTITPAPFHSPAIARLIPDVPVNDLRWFDARASLLIPRAPIVRLIIPGFTPIAPELRPYLEMATLTHTIPMRPDDLDRPIWIYEMDTNAAQTAWLDNFLWPDGLSAPVWIGDNLQFLGYVLSETAVRPGDTVALITWWQVERPLPNAVLFTHLLAQNGRPLAQTDRLDAPGALWQRGDWLIQLHLLTIPANTPAGQYPLVTGLYTNPDGLSPQPRLPITANHKPTGDTITLTTLTVTP